MVEDSNRRSSKQKMGKYCCLFVRSVCFCLYWWWLWWYSMLVVSVTVVVTEEVVLVVVIVEVVEIVNFMLKL